MLESTSSRFSINGQATFYIVILRSTMNMGSRECTCFMGCRDVRNLEIMSGLLRELTIPDLDSRMKALVGIWLIARQSIQILDILFM